MYTYNGTLRHHFSSSQTISLESPGNTEQELQSSQLQVIFLFQTEALHKQATTLSKTQTLKQQQRIEERPTDVRTDTLSFTENFVSCVNNPKARLFCCCTKFGKDDAGLLAMIFETTFCSFLEMFFLKIVYLRPT